MKLISPSTRPGISVLPLTPPNAVPRQVRPVTYEGFNSHVNLERIFHTSWKLERSSALARKKRICILRSSGDLLTSSCNPDHSRDTPSFVTSLKSGPHNMNLESPNLVRFSSDFEEIAHISSAIKCEVQTTISYLDQVILDLLTAFQS